MFSRTHETPAQHVAANAFGCGFVMPDVPRGGGGSSFANAQPVNNGAFSFSSSSSTDKPVATTGFSFSSPSPFATSSSGASGSSLFSAPPTTSGFGVPRSNPLGRGRSTRECFDANDDKRFAKPAFAQKPSAWAAIAALSKARPRQQSRGGFIFQAKESGSMIDGRAFGAPHPSKSPFGFQPSVAAPTAAPPGSSFQPIAYVDHMGQSGRLHSISAAPAHANQSFEELRFAGLPAPQRSIFGGSSSSSVAPTSTAVFGDSRLGKTSTTTRTFTFGVDSWNPSLAQPTATVFGGGSFSGFDAVVGKRDANLTTTFGPRPSTTPSDPFATQPTSGGPTSIPGPFPSVSDAQKNEKPASESTASWPIPHFHLDSPYPTTSSKPTPKPAFQSLSKDKLRSDMPPSASPFTASFGADKVTEEKPPTFAFRAAKVSGASDNSSVENPSVEPVFSFRAPAALETQTTEPSEEAESAPSAEEASLALPKPKTSYANVSGSRATAFIRRSRQLGGKASVAESQRLAVAALTSSCKPSPTKKPIERIVVGRKDAELWKRGGLTTSLFVESAQAATMAMWPVRQEELKAEAAEETTTRENEKPPVVSAVSLDDDDL